MTMRSEAAARHRSFSGARLGKDGNHIYTMTNRLAQSQSLYLRKHAENPINWWSWSEEALEKAKIENKLIFLSIQLVM